MKSDNLVYILVIMHMVSFIFAQECDSGYVYIEDVPSCCGAPAEHCFYENDLLVLEKFIENSEETINLLLDNNEDGEMSPLELGFTEWSNGRLVSLDCYLSNIMNCNLSGEIPENIGDLEYLETLWLNGNQLSGEIPESIGNLMNIELLYLSENNFTGSIPASICNLNIDFDGENNWGVEYFNIWGNDLCPPNPDCLSADIVGAQNCIDYSGDLNLDGEINILDIVFIANIILDYNQYISEADINQDNEINILDVITLAAMILD